MIAGPGVEGARTFRGFAYVTDIMPTLLALAGVEHPSTFEGREVVLGPRAGDYYVVVDGVREGEEVVVRGNFKIDSALQIQAKPSVMYPTGGGGGAGHQHHHGAAPATTPDGPDGHAGASEVNRLPIEAVDVRAVDDVGSVYAQES